MRLLIGLGLTGFALAAPAAGSAQPRRDNLAARVDSIFAPWDKSNSPGCGVGITRNGKLVYQRGYGMANLEYGLAITPASIFHVASISKQFTATAIMLLARQGRLSLDDEVRKYITELPDYGTRVTIRHLLTHTSGLRDQWSLLSLAGWRADDVITEDDVLKIVARQRALNFAPGSEYLYSNSGFTLLAIIVKRVSGQSLRAFADSAIFKPLGMTNTHFHDDHSMLVPNRTSAYEFRQGAWHVSIPVFDTYGATSLFTTVEDLLTWEHNLDQPTVGDRAMFSAMEAPTMLAGGDTSFYGFGLALQRHRGLWNIGHAGADAGYRADVVRFPGQGLAVTALCNLGSINPSNLTRQVASAYLAEYLGPPVSSAPSPAVTLPAEQLAAKTGLYRNPKNDGVRRVAVREGKLVGIAGLAGVSELTPISGSRFLTAGGNLTIEFLPVDGPPQELRELAEGQPPAVFRRVPAWAPTPAELGALAGDYTSPELMTTWTLVVRDTILVIQTPRRGELNLQPTFVDGFLGTGGVGTVRFFRDAKGAITGLTVNTGRVRSLRFDRVRSSSTR